MREELHADDQLAVFLTIADDDIVRVEIESRAPETCDLSIADEVIVFLDEQRVAVDAEEPAYARAELGPAAELLERSFKLMLRVHDFFEGWEFGEP